MRRTASISTGLTDIFARHTFDNTTGLTWDLMTNAQRQASAINFGNVVWIGGNVYRRRAECSGLR